MTMLIGQRIRERLLKQNITTCYNRLQENTQQNQKRYCIITARPCCTQRDIGAGMLSVHLSVSLSVTVSYYVKTAKHTAEILSKLNIVANFRHGIVLIINGVSINSRFFVIVQQKFDVLAYLGNGAR